MSENNKTTPKYIYYDSLSSTELENYLLMDLESEAEESLAIEDLYIITEILSKRSPHQSFHASKGWDSFKNDYLPYLEDIESTTPKTNMSITKRKALKAIKTKFFNSYGKDENAEEDKYKIQEQSPHLCCLNQLVLTC